MAAPISFASRLPAKCFLVGTSRGLRRRGGTMANSTTKASPVAGGSAELCADSHDHVCVVDFGVCQICDPVHALADWAVDLVVIGPA